MRRLCIFSLSLLSLCLLSPLAIAAIDFTWPTPLPVLRENMRDTDFLQATASGEVESGGFGCVRNGGHKFHEGIDIRPQSRDRRGEPTDEIYAAMDGVVRHVNSLAGESNYGRYIVIEHPDQKPCVYTLYAHLARITPGLRAGDRVGKGQVIATMGHTSNGNIPRDRAHLHFEIGLMETRDFQSWYNWKKFGSTNEHGAWNGMNLLGISAWDFIAKWRRGEVREFTDYFAQLPVALKLRVATNRVPDFIQRYPALQTAEPSGLVAGWEVCLGPTGLPFRWTPLSPMQVAGLRPGQVMITDVNEDILRRDRCRELVKTRRGQRVPGKDLEPIIELIFGLR